MAQKIRFELKKRALFAVLNKDFDSNRLIIYDLVKDVIKNEDYLDYVKDALEKIEVIRDLSWELEAADDENSYNSVDKTYFKHIDHEIFVDALVEVYNVNKSVAEAICIDLYGKLYG